MTLPVTTQERSLLSLVAKRIYQAPEQEDDAFSILQCGMFVQLRYVTNSEGVVTQLVRIRKHPSFTPEEIKELAEEIAGCELISVPRVENVLEYHTKR